MNGKLKLGLAILAVAVLVLNPIAACASMWAANSAHHCCKRVSVTSADCATPGCVCINSTPIQTPVPPDSNDGLALALPANTAQDVMQAAAGEQPTFAPVVFTPLDRYLTFHQLLL